MQSDDLIWDVIGPGFCSFRIKSDSRDFCKNEFNVTGLCDRASCPLANSQYATVREIEGCCYLYVKTVERAHLPSKLWERIKLSRDYARALEQIDTELQYWREETINRCKQRLTQILQYLKRMRALELQHDLPELLPRKSKIERRDRSREIAAERAARIEQTIEKEVLERLKNGTYGDIYNFNQKAFELALQRGDEFKEQDMDEEDEIEDEDEDEREFVEDFDDEEDLEDLFCDASRTKNGKFIDDYLEESDSDADNGEGHGSSTTNKKKKRQVEIEYENEDIEEHLK